MTDISDKTVQKIAHLARLAIEPQALPEYAKNLSNILTLIDQMNSIDTTHIEPMAHPLTMSQRMREDKITEPNQREALQQLTPFTESGLYLVPQVIDDVG